MSILMVGGHSDGDHFEQWPPPRYVRMPIREKIDFSSIRKYEEPFIQMSDELYRLEKLHCGERVFFVYCLNSLPTDVMIDMLFQGYRRPWKGTPCE